MTRESFFFFYFAFMKIKILILLALIAPFTYSSCKKSSTCTFKTWYIDVTDHPLVDGHCVDNNSPLQIKFSGTRDLTVPCPAVSTNTVGAVIYTGFVNKTKTGTPLLQMVGSAPVGSTVSATFTLEALCCCNDKGDYINCSTPSKGAKSIYELKTTLVTQKPVINTFGITMTAKSWKLISPNCCP